MTKRFHIIALGDHHGENPHGPYSKSEAQSIVSDTEKIVTAEQLKIIQLRPHGGARKGAGRKPPLGKPTIPKTIQLTPDEWKQLARIHKTPSQAVRKLLQGTR